MIEPRVYSVVLASTASAAAIDWFELIAPSTCGIGLFAIDLGQSTDFGDAAEEGIRYFIKRAGGSYTSGSGGNTGVARTSTRSGDAAATFTAETANTTQLVVSTGTLVTCHASVFNVRTGLDKFWTPETAITCKASEAIVIGMSAAPTDSITWEGTAYVAEIMG